MREQFKFDKAAIEWRRNIVLQKLSMGWSQSEIAAELKLHPSTISLDCQYLRIKSQEEMKSYLQDTIPFQHKQTMTGLTQVLRDLWEIAKHSTKISERLQAYALINESYKHIMDMSTNPASITRAMEFVMDINQKKIQQETEPSQETELTDCERIEQEQEEEQQNE
jgi:hypothetical protein